MEYGVEKNYLERLFFVVEDYDDESKDDILKEIFHRIFPIGVEASID